MFMIFMPFAAILIAAAIFDLLTMTIPNWLCGLLAVSFLLSALIVHLPLDALLSHFGCALAMLGATFLLFTCGWLGGGDAKLTAAIALWVGWTGLPAFLVQTALWGGALAAFILMARSLPLPLIFINQKFVSRLINPASGAPYGVALAMGGFFALPHTVLWRLAEGA